MGMDRGDIWGRGTGRGSTGASGMDVDMEGGMKPENKADWALILSLFSIIRRGSREVVGELERVGRQLMAEQEVEDQLRNTRFSHQDKESDPIDSENVVAAPTLTGDHAFKAKYERKKA
jgi:hypothetical protein